MKAIEILSYVLLVILWLASVCLTVAAFIGGLVAFWKLVL